MKLLKSLVVLVLICPVLAFAEPLIPADRALAKAKTGRMELREVVMSLSFNAAEMRDVQTFESYFFLLDSLQEIAKGNGFEELYPGVIETLGVTMTSQGIRWLSIVNSSEDKLKYYLKWMNSTGVGRLLGLVEYELKDISSPEVAKRIARNIDAIMPLIEQKSGNVPYIMLGYKRIQSDAAVSLLKMDTLSETEAQEWISKIALSSSASEYLDYLNKDIYSLTKNNVGNAHKHLVRLQGLLHQTTKLAEITPGWLVTSIGESINELIVKMLRYEEKFFEEEIETALGALKPRQLQSLAQQIINFQIPPSAAYVNEYLRVANLLVNGLYNSNQIKEGDDLKKALAKTSAPVVAQKYNIEGHYKLSNGSKNPYYLTIAMSRENSLVAAFSDSTMAVAKAFYSVTYNALDNTFVATERDPDLDAVQNIAIKFTVSEKGTVKLFDPYLRAGNQHFTGSKIQSLPSLWKDAVNESTNPQGTYTGQIVLPDGKKLNIKLIVTAFNGYTVARIDSKDLTIELNIGSAGTDGVLVLTSGRTIGASWFQLRSKVVKGGLQSTVIIGGKGISKTSTFLKKISN